MSELNGGLVLSSQRITPIPMFSVSSLREHIPGSFNGSVGGSSTFQRDFYDPTRGREFSVGCSSDLLDVGVRSLVESVSAPAGDGLHSTRDQFHAAASGLSMESPSVLSLEQRMPFGFVCLHSRHVDLHFFGLYNSSCSVVYWSTIDNIEEVLRTSHPNVFWLHRFRPIRDFSLVLYVKRICSRWYRWSETLPHPSQRFQALETSLQNSMRKTDRSICTTVS